MPLISFPAHALLIVEERLKEQQAEGIRMPEGIELDELALRVLLVAGLHKPRTWLQKTLPGERESPLSPD